jgi:5-formyltetrahydrofolate cyclo-ligase
LHALRNKLRQTYRAKRKALSLTEQRHASLSLLKICQADSDFQQAKTIALYLANDGEIDLSAVIEYCWQQGKAVFLPVLHPFCKGHLLFVRYTANSVMSANCYGIAEPIVRCQDICPLAQLDMILTPLVAFDTQGNRLGMGGGFYDRTLAPIVRDGLNTQLVGVAHHCQQAELLPTEPWDIPLKKIITSNHVLNCSSK